MFWLYHYTGVLDSGDIIGCDYDDEMGRPHFTAGFSLFFLRLDAFVFIFIPLPHSLLSPPQFQCLVILDGKQVKASAASLLRTVSKFL